MGKSLCTVRSSGVDQSNAVGPREMDPLESTVGQEEVSVRSTASGVDRPRASPRFSIIKALGELDRPWKCPLLIPMGRDNRGGGDTVGGSTRGGGTVGAWRSRASAPHTVIIDKERWFSSHTPVTKREDPTHEGSVHGV